LAPALVHHPRRTDHHAASVDEARAVDLSIDTTVCRWHRGWHTHLNVDGTVYYCPIGQMYWRYAKQPSGFLKPLQYAKSGV
jgi:hypothetical protein